MSGWFAAPVGRSNAATILLNLEAEICAKLVDRIAQVALHGELRERLRQRPQQAPSPALRAGASHQADRQGCPSRRSHASADPLHAPAEESIKYRLEQTTDTRGCRRTHSSRSALPGRFATRLPPRVGQLHDQAGRSISRAPPRPFAAAITVVSDSFPDTRPSLRRENRPEVGGVDHPVEPLPDPRWIGSSDALPDLG